jgi:hypothetical protein
LKNLNKTGLQQFSEPSQCDIPLAVGLITLAVAGVVSVLAAGRGVGGSVPFHS